MKKILFIALFMLLLSSIAFLDKSMAAPAPTLGRAWTYPNLTLGFSPEWSFTIMPGYRFEFYRSEGDTLNSFLYELFVGPNYTKRFSDLTLKLSLWYYYSGFDLNRGSLNSFLYSHNIEFVPAVDYKIGKFTLSDRILTHSKIYAANNWFTTSDQRWGYSLLLRQMLKVGYSITSTLSVFVADEIFIGLIEDNDTKKIRKGEPFFEEKGFSKNRVYLGGAYKVTPSFSISPQYVLETNYNPADKHKLKTKEHYIFLGLDYVLKLYE